MIVYHGSYAEIQTPNLNYGRYNLDFGKGFYVTGLKEQAEKWAVRRATMANIVQNIENPKSIVNVYEIDIAATELSILAFYGYTEEWLDFVVMNRGLRETQLNDKYDIIFGNVADDDVAAVVDDYMRLADKGRIDESGKSFFIKQLQFSKPNDQYCIVSQKAIDMLKFLKSYEVKF